MHKHLTLYHALETTPKYLVNLLRAKEWLAAWGTIAAPHIRSQMSAGIDMDRLILAFAKATGLHPTPSAITLAANQAIEHESIKARTVQPRGMGGRVPDPRGLDQLEMISKLVDPAREELARLASVNACAPDTVDALRIADLLLKDISRIYFGS